MDTQQTLEFACATNNVESAMALARSLHGILYHDDREQWQHLPFRALLTVVTDDVTALEEVTDVGLYVVCRRVVKAGDCNVIGLFPMVRHEALSHQQSDAHWRDVHGPLALTHHAHMTHYAQLSVVHQISGPQFDGFALCGFATLEDLRERFYTTPASQDVIAQDVAKFADTRRSPRRLIASPTSYR